MSCCCCRRPNVSVPPQKSLEHGWANPGRSVRLAVSISASLYTGLLACPQRTLPIADRDARSSAVSPSVQVRTAPNTTRCCHRAGVKHSRCGRRPVSERDRLLCHNLPAIGLQVGQGVNVDVRTRGSVPSA